MAKALNKKGNYKYNVKARVGIVSRRTNHKHI